MLARPMDPRGKAEGGYLVAVDTVDAGVGERCRRQRQLGPSGFGHEGLPVDAAIVGMVDTIETR